MLVTLLGHLAGLQALQRGHMEAGAGRAVQPWGLNALRGSYQGLRSALQGTRGTGPASHTVVTDYPFHVASAKRLVHLLAAIDQLIMCPRQKHNEKL
jgi:hypothetical protein